MRAPRLITRRRAIVAGLAAAAGGLAVVRSPRELPPTYGNLLRLGDDFTYAAHRVLLPGQSLAREYAHHEITSFPATGTTDPGGIGRSGSDTYRALQEKEFADWRLPIEGLVRSARSFSLPDLKRFPGRSQITRHTCEEGWSAIAQWTGVPLGLVLDAVGLLSAARFVVFYSYDDYAESIDLLDAFHPQTLLAYGMNGRELAIAHGAPVRLRVERQLGYKSLKYLQRVVVTDQFEDGGEKGDIQNGWAWYTGI